LTPTWHISEEYHRTLKGLYLRNIRAFSQHCGFYQLQAATEHVLAGIASGVLERVEVGVILQRNRAYKTLIIPIVAYAAETWTMMRPTPPGLTGTRTLMMAHTCIVQWLAYLIILGQGKKFLA
jgi:hypothetical protein